MRGVCVGITDGVAWRVRRAGAVDATDDPARGAKARWALVRRGLVVRPVDDSRHAGLPGSTRTRARFRHASDTHIDTTSAGRVRRFRAMDDSIGPAFTLMAGDLIKDSMSQQEPQARAWFELFLSEMKPLRAPYWAVPGNHDHFGIIQSRSHVPATHPLYNRGMYRSYLGPEYYSFNYGGVHFIGLDTVQPDDSAYYGGVDSVQLAWLARDVAALPASMPIVAFAHIPLTSGFDTMIGYSGMALVSGTALEHGHVVPPHRCEHHRGARRVQGACAAVHAGRAHARRGEDRVSDGPRAAQVRAECGHRRGQ